jgi:hypothetical protein
MPTEANSFALYMRQLLRHPCAECRASGVPCFVWDLYVFIWFDSLLMKH